MFDFDPNKNYYDILWVSEGATEEDIKKAYRKLAMQHHPDRNKWNKDAEETFKKVNEAYQVVWDKQKRQQYDSFRKWWFSGFWWMWGSSWFGGFWWGATFQVDDIFDVFGSFFWWSDRWWWRTRSRKTPSRWDDMVMNLEINVEDAYKGLKKEVKFTRLLHCHGCEGKWVSKDSQRNACSVCHGSWVSQSVQKTPFGMMQVQTTCTKCWWEWYADSKPCVKCWWSWFEKKQEKIQVNIPAGINGWEYIKYPGMWNYWRYWWEAWDFFVKIVVREWKYKRVWNDLYTDAEVNIYDAVIWGQISVDHPDGKLKVKVPKWMQVWDKIIVSWKWFWESGFFAKKWDFIVIPKILIPKKLSKEEEKLWKQLKDNSSK